MNEPIQETITALSGPSVVPEPNKQIKLGQFINSAGEVFTICGLSPLEPQRITDSVRSRWEKAGKLDLLKPVTYSVLNVANVPTEFEHDDESIKTASPEEIEKYLAHIKAKAEFDADVNMRTMRGCFLCVMEDPNNDVDWLEKMAYQEIDLPTNRYALKALYVETRVLRSAEDVPHFMTAVMRLSGMVDEATAQAAEATFQRAIQGASAQDA